MNKTKMDAGTSFTNLLSESKTNGQKINAGLMVQNVVKSCSRAEEEKVFETIFENLSCLSVPFMSQLDAELFWFIEP